MTASAPLRLLVLLLCLVALSDKDIHGPFSPAMAQDSDDDDDGGDDGGDDDDSGSDDSGSDDSGSDDSGSDDDDSGSDDDSSSDDDDSGNDDGDDGSRSSDDDDEGDENDDNDAGRQAGSGGGGAGTGAVVTPRPVRQQERQPSVVNELVALSLSDADVAVLLARGYRVIEERDIAGLNAVSRRLAVPQGTSVEDARSEVRALAPAAQADFNHYYRTEQDPDAAADPAADPAFGAAFCEGPHCASFQLIGWSVGATRACSADAAIGVIDTGINPDHETFSTSRLEVHRLAPGNLDPSRAIHGTAVTALLIGDAESRSPGLLPDARVVAVDAFHTEDGDERADVYTLVAAMDFLAAKGIRVVNLSLAGPPNAVLEETVARLVERDILLVAATGNVGPNADPVYPAAYPGVLAVTAVDRSGNVYRRAGRGAHVDLAAPGVDIWTAASIRGARPKTGTSFAAPFVSAAAAAVLAAEPDLTAAQVAARLTGSARDLGDPGPDEVYGYGLVQAVPACLTEGGTSPDAAAKAAPDLAAEIGAETGTATTPAPAPITPAGSTTP